MWLSLGPSLPMELPFATEPNIDIGPSPKYKRGPITIVAE